MRRMYSTLLFFAEFGEDNERIRNRTINIIIPHKKAKMEKFTPRRKINLMIFIPRLSQKLCNR